MTAILKICPPFKIQIRNVGEFLNNTPNGNGTKFYKGHFCTTNGDWYELKYDFCDNRLFFHTQPKKVIRKSRMVEEFYFEEE